MIVRPAQHTPRTPCKAIEAVDGQGRVRGRIGYNDWTPSSVRMHVALDGVAASRALLRPAFQYPFLQCGRRVVWGLVPDGSPSLRLALHAGFREAHRIRDGWAPGVDLVHVEMRREDCRWIQPRERKAA